MKKRIKKDTTAWTNETTGQNGRQEKKWIKEKR